MFSLESMHFKCLEIDGHTVSTSMCYHTPLIYMFVPLSTRWSKGNRGVRLLPVCVQSFAYIMHQRILNSLPFLPYDIVNSLRPGDMPCYWWTVCFLTLMRHWSDGAVKATVRSMMGCLPVDVNSTAIGDAPGALTVAAGVTQNSFSRFRRILSPEWLYYISQNRTRANIMRNASKN